MRSFIVVLPILLLTYCAKKPSVPVPGKVEAYHELEIVDGIHVESGLKDDPELPIIIANCTACHSGKLVTQNRANREGWKNIITWMQETQKLWDLGENEVIVLDYLERNYSPEQSVSRRINLDVEWYDFD